jgi:acetyltransferase-like isoleucine patch superfamily enzyme
MVNESRISATAKIYENVNLGENVSIAEYAIIYPNVKIGASTFIGPYCIIGEPVMNYYNNPEHVFASTNIGKDSVIRSHSVIYEDVFIGDGFQTGHHVTIREKTKIGCNCSVGTLSDLQGYLKIGDYVRLHSNVHIGRLTTIEDYVWIYPYVVTTNDPLPPMGDLAGCTIRKFAQIATGAILLPGLEIGENSLVGAGTIVTKNVPAYSVCVGVPGKIKGSVTDIKDKNGNEVYPWKEHLTKYRGYPWQKDN